MKDELLDILACPVCKQGLSSEGDELVCRSCRRRYPVRDGIPVLLAEQSRREGPEGGEA